MGCRERMAKLKVQLRTIEEENGVNTIAKSQTLDKMQQQYSKLQSDHSRAREEWDKLVVHMTNKVNGWSCGSW